MTCLVVNPFISASGISVTDQTIAGSEFDPSDSEARYQLTSAGAANKYTETSGYVAISGEWLLGGSASDYECRFTPTIGTLTSGPTGWNALSSTREWTVARTSPGSKSCTGTIEIGLVGTSTAIDSATIVLSAEVL